VFAVAVPTAFFDLSAAVAEAVVSKPLAVALLERAESVTRLKRRPAAQPAAARGSPRSRPWVASTSSARSLSCTSS
jgi:hypothetical protein